MKWTKPGVDGYHLTYDLMGCDREFLADEERIRVFIEGLADEVGMQRIRPTASWAGSASLPEDWGVSVSVLIAESHVYTHTFPEKGCAWLDIFSCRKIPEVLVEQIVLEAYRPTQHRMEMKRRDLKGME